MAERKFKVKCIAISLKKNKIARATEEVDESQLAGDPDVLVKDGYIIEIESNDEPKELSEMTVTELKAFVEENELDVDLSLNKAPLLEAIIEAVKTDDDTNNDGTDDNGSD